MECPKCGNFLDENETSCKNCGAKIKENTLNQISKGGGKTKTPTEEEKAEAKAEQIKKMQEEQRAQQQAQAEAEKNAAQENSISQEEYVMLQRQLASARKNTNFTLGIVIILIVVFATFGGVLLFHKINSDSFRAIKSTNSDVEDNVTTKKENPSTEPQSPSGSTGSEAKEDGQKSITNTTDVQIDDYVFSFPNNYQTQLQDGMGISVDYYNKIQFVYTIMKDVSYQDSLNTAKDFKSYLNEVGFKVNNYEEKTYTNRKWLIFYGTLKDMDSMYAITSIGTGATFQVTIYNLGNKSNDDVYVELTSIVNGAKTKGSSGNNNPGSGGSSSGGSSSGTSKNKPSTGSTGSVTA